MKIFDYDTTSLCKTYFLNCPCLRTNRGEGIKAIISHHGFIEDIFYYSRTKNKFSSWMNTNLHQYSFVKFQRDHLCYRSSRRLAIPRRDRAFKWSYTKLVNRYDKDSSKTFTSEILAEKSTLKSQMSQLEILLSF